MYIIYFEKKYITKNSMYRLVIVLLHSLKLQIKSKINSTFKSRYVVDASQYSTEYMSFTKPLPKIRQPLHFLLISFCREMSSCGRTRGASSCRRRARPSYASLISNPEVPVCSTICPIVSPLLR